MVEDRVPLRLTLSRNKSKFCIDAVIHLSGDELPLGIPLKTFVLFVDQLLFLG